MRNEAGLKSMSPLLQSLRPCRFALLSAAVISGIINCLYLIGPLFMMEVYDRVLPSKSLPTLLALFAIVAALYACQGVLDMFRSRILSRVGALVDASVSRATFGTIISSALRRSRDDAMHQPIHDLDQIRTFLGGPCPGALFDLPWMPLYLAVCFSFHVWIGLAAVGGAFTLLLLTLLTDLLSRKSAMDASVHAAMRTYVAAASRRGAEVVRALGMEEQMASLWTAKNDAFVASQLRLSDVASGFGAISKVIRMLLQSGVLALGALLIIKGEVSAGTILASSILVSRALAPVEVSIVNWRNFVSARQSWGNLNRALTAVRDAAAAMSLPQPAKTLIVSNVAVAPPNNEKPTIQGVNLTLIAGSALAIVGPSGAGKTSLARTLVGIWAPLHGSVRLDGALLQHYGTQVLGRSLGYLPQDVELFTGSIAENIARFDPNAAAADIITAARAADVHDMIQHLSGGYKTQIGEAGAVLSSGQRQRIGLARALYGEPFLVVLDEPNSNLDAEGEAALTRAISAIRSRKGIAVVIAHRASALAACDMVLMVANGRAQMMSRKDEVVRLVQPETVAAEETSQEPAMAAGEIAS
jgi:PrtD family type I secretion system ABC transporter